MKHEDGLEFKFLRIKILLKKNKEKTLLFREWIKVAAESKTREKLRGMGPEGGTGDNSNINDY